MVELSNLFDVWRGARLNVSDDNRTGASDSLGCFVMLEPYAGKLARTVLRGGGLSNEASLPDSFSPDDCQVLARVLNGNSAVNLQKIDLIINHLNLIKKALLDNVSRQEVANLIQETQETQEGGADTGLPIPMHG